MRHLSVLLSFIAVVFTSNIYSAAPPVQPPRHFYVCASSTTIAEFSVLPAYFVSVFQWQEYNYTTSTWDNISDSKFKFAGATTATLSVYPQSTWPSKQPISPRKFRCRYTTTKYPIGTYNTSEAQVRVMATDMTVEAPIVSPSSSVCAGSNITFGINANGSNLQYQWYEGSLGISGANAYTYTYSRTYPNTTQAFKCKLTMTCGTSISKTSTAVNEPTILQSPVITSQPPATKSGCEGTYVSFSLAANGSGTLNYTWKKNNFDISPAQNSNNLVFNPSSTSQTGNYTCYITHTGNSCTVTSSACALTINQNVAVTQNPQSQTVGATGTVNFQVTATGTVSNYRWQLWNGTSWNNISDGVNIAGATTSQLTLSNVSAGSYQYRCFIDGACNDVYSTAAVLTVTSQPAITVHPKDTTGCIGSNAEFKITANNVTSYRWEVSTNGGTNWDSTGTNSAILSVPITTLSQNGYLYKCIAKGSGGNTTSDVASLGVKSPVSITTQPLAKNKCKGDSVAMLVKATGSNITYKWYKDAVAEGTEDDTLQYEELFLGQQGNYYCAVAGYCGTVNSNTVFMKVSDLPHPNDLGNDTTFCWKQKVTLDPGAYSTYLWNTGAQTRTIDADSSLTYWVQVTDANGCKALTSRGVNILKPYAGSSICMVTYHAPINKNIVIWDRLQDNKIASYNVYKIVGAKYELLGNVKFDSLSVYEDKLSSPSIKSDQYAISVIDGCGNESALSKSISTMLLQASKGTSVNEANLIWTKYVDESGAFVPEYYYIYKGKTKEDMTLLDSVSGILAPLYIDQKFDGKSAYYKLEIRKPDTCAPALLKAEAGPYAQSLSNIAEYKTTGLDNSELLEASAYPNPFNGVLTLSFYLESASDATIEWIDATGRKLSIQTLSSLQAGVNIVELQPELPSGMYSLKITAGNKTQVIKVAKQ